MNTTDGQLRQMIVEAEDLGYSTIAEVLYEFEQLRIRLNVPQGYMWEEHGMRKYSSIKPVGMNCVTLYRKD